MISKWLYIHECTAAGIELGITEKAVLDSVSHDGWFDKEEYLEAMIHAKPAVYITKNQRKIMDWLPQHDDDPFTGDEKNHRRVDIVKRIKRINGIKMLKSISEKNSKGVEG